MDAAFSPETVTVLMVDADVDFCAGVVDLLRTQGVQAHSAGTAAQGLAALARLQPDVLLLSQRLPDATGLDLCRHLREFGNDVPVLLLTPRHDRLDRIRSLELGADDYLGKPFEPRELVARVRALARRLRAASRRQQLQFEGLTLDLLARRAVCQDEPLALTPTEFKLLVALASQPGLSVSRQALANALQSASYKPMDRAVDVQVARLRKKLAVAAGGRDWIKTARGEGYVFTARSAGGNSAVTGPPLEPLAAMRRPDDLVADELVLLDVPHLRRAGVRHELPSNVPGLMLAYLACRGDWVARETLVGLFWPQRAEQEALHNLRVNLHRLKKLLASWGLAERLDAQWRRVRLTLPTDVAAFRTALASADWAQATQRHRAPLLADLSIPGFAAVDEWFAAQRQVLQQGWHQAARQHAGHLLAAGDASGAFALLIQQLATDLLAEDLVLALLRAARAVGERESALQHYERFRQRLRDELGLEPMAQTVAEVQRMRAELPDNAPRPAAERGGTPPPSAPRLHAGPLTGRAEELQQLAQATRPIIVLGEPGAGKTRLLEEACPRAIWFSCREDYQAEPLRPVADTFNDAIDALQSLPVVARWRSVLSHLVPALTAGEQPPPLEATGGDRLIDAVVEVLAALDRPLVFDDLQWADAATLALLSRLMTPSAGPGPRLRVAAAARSDEVGLELHRRLDALEASGNLQRLALPRLTPNDLAVWLQRLSGNTPVPAFANWLHARSGGNPFFVLETLRALFISGRLRTDSGKWAGDFEALAQDDATTELPARTAALVRRRVERLSESGRRVLTIAALAGDARALEPLALVAGLTPWAIADAITEAQHAELLVGRRFAHELVRQSLIANTPEALQQVLHASIARHCGDCLAPHALAAHWWAAGEVSTAVTETLRAAARDCACGWQAHASALLRDALARTDAGDARARLTGALARTTMEQGDFERARALALEALQALPAPPTRQQTLLLLGEIALQQGQLDTAAQLHDEAAQIDPELPELWLLEGKIAFDRGDFMRNVEAHTRLLRLLRRRAPDTTLVLTLSALGAAHDALAQTDAAIACHREALATARSLGARYAEVDAAVNLLWSLSEAGQHNEAIRIGEQGLALGRYDATPALMNNLAWLYLDLDRLDEAETLYRSLCDEADPTIRCFAWAKRVDIGARRGDRVAVDQAIEHGLASLDCTDLYRAHAVVIIATLEHGKPDAVRRAAKRLRKQPVDPFLQRRLDSLIARHGLDVAHLSQGNEGCSAAH